MRSGFFLNYIIIVLIGTYALSASAQATVVMGRIKNATAGERVELYVPHHYIDNEAGEYKVQLDHQLQFSIVADIREPQVAFLIYGQDQLAVFLEPHDTLMIKTDMFQFPVSVDFGGRAGANNKLFRQYAAMQTSDYNEFNNVRFKVGQWWFAIESVVNDTMLQLDRNAFIGWANEQQKTAFDLYDRFMADYPGALTQGFREWLETEVIFNRAYNLLMYGQVYKNRYQITPDYFDFLTETPLVVNALGSESYRQFLQVFMARKQLETGENAPFYATQYEQAGALLEGKPLSWFRSEIIRMAFSSDRFQEIAPSYMNYLRHNNYPEFESKITALYERTSRFAPGMMSPPFAGKDYLSSIYFSNSSLYGKVIYLNFWASWCGACVKKMDFFTENAAELSKAGITVVNISIDENELSWIESLKSSPTTGYHLLAKLYPEQAMAATFGVQAVPQYYIIDKNGAIAQKPYSNQPDEIMKRLLEVARGK